MRIEMKIKLFSDTIVPEIKETYILTKQLDLITIIIGLLPNTKFFFFGYLDNS